VVPMAQMNRLLITYSLHFPLLLPIDGTTHKSAMKGP
jgi:hypothetical protein